MRYELTRSVLGAAASVEISSQRFYEIERAKRNLIEGLYIEEKSSLVNGIFSYVSIDLPPFITPEPTKLAPVLSGSGCDGY